MIRDNMRTAQIFTFAHILNVTTPIFEPTTGSLGTTSTVYHQLDSVSDSSAPACCTMASAPYLNGQQLPENMSLGTTDTAALHWHQPTSTSTNLSVR
jgi:hypothetical protein